MAALDFPASPTVGQIYTANGKSWQWDGTSWNAYNPITSLTGVTLSSCTINGSTNLDGNITVTGSYAISAAASQSLTLNGGAGTNGLVLNSSNNVGIGTSSPGAKLSVLSATNNGIAVNDGTINTIVYNSSTGNGSIGTTTNHPLAFYTNNAERMRIDASGNVLVSGAGGLGYGTGSGGAVTQATSRTTGVTLNKTNGAITLVSAAGSATYQTFTVTNSTVAATDVIHVCQKSGTDKYIVLVIAVAAGSFSITFATTGGTTTEQPVFNFAVLKAVAA